MAKSKTIHTPNKSAQRQTETPIVVADGHGMTAADVRLRNQLLHRVQKLRSRDQLERVNELLNTLLSPSSTADGAGLRD